MSAPPPETDTREPPRDESRDESRIERRIESRIGLLDEPQAHAERRETALLIALFAAGWLVFDYPLLSLWMGDATLFGIPLLPAALFAAWGAIVAALAWIAERNRS